MNYKLNITNLPTYNDGNFKLYEIKQKDEPYPIEYLHESTRREVWYEELSITDKLRFQSEQRDKKITMKIRIAQDKSINSLNVLKIGEEYHKVFNAYHFTNNEGIRQTDLTLEEYANPRLEEEV